MSHATRMYNKVLSFLFIFAEFVSQLRFNKTWISYPVICYKDK